MNSNCSLLNANIVTNNYHPWNYYETKIEPHKFDVIIIDSIDLVPDYDKINWNNFLSKNNLVIILTNLNEITGYIKKTRKPVDYCNSWLTWLPEDKTSHLINIDIKKSRDNKLFSFKLKSNFECITFQDA